MQDLKIFLSTQGYQRLRRGHPWITASHFTDELPLPASSGLCHLGEHWFFYSPQSELRMRRFGPSTRLWMAPDESLQDGFFLDDRERFSATFSEFLTEHFRLTLETKMQTSLETDDDLCFRWIFSEADLVPGLIVDVFGNVLSCQILTAPIEHFWPEIRKCLVAAFSQLLNQTPEQTPEIRELRNSSVRKKEGLEVISTARTENRQWLRWNGLSWWMQAGSSQKTGAYFDQRENHKKAALWAEKLKIKTAWDICCFEGGFGLHLAKKKLQVIAVDQSAAALEVAAKNAAQNGISSEHFQTAKADMFEWLRNQFDNKKTVDAVVLDPPSLTRNKGQVPQALQGYRELNFRALKQINSNGLLVTCSCSQHISQDSFKAILSQAAHDARREVKVLERSGPSADHAFPVGFPEGEYLQTWFLLVK